jgi:uncharacterized membrane-anchored protein YhcB (DUF1043 family)
MKAAIAIIILAVILALTTESPTIEDRVEAQMEESQKLCDSARAELKRIHDANEILLNKHFPK